MSKLLLTNKSIKIPWESPLMCQYGVHSCENMEYLLIWEYVRFTNRLSKQVYSQCLGLNSIMTLKPFSDRTSVMNMKSMSNEWKLCLLQYGGDTRWTQTTLEVMKEMCLDLIEQNVTFTNSPQGEKELKTLRDMNCLSECSGHGSCIEGRHFYWL